MPLISSHHLRLFLCLSLFLFNHRAIAQTDQVSLGRLLWSDFLSPLTTDAQYVFMTGLVGTNLILLDEHDLNTQIKNEADENQPLGQYGYIGEVVGWGFLNAFYTIGMGIHGLASPRDRSLERAEMMSISSIYTLAWTTLGKFTIREERPNYTHKKDSFPSGHASMAFNFSTMVWAEHGAWYGVPATILASLISYSRVQDGWHRMSDVIAGATIGMSYGLGVHLNRRNNRYPFIFEMIRGPDNTPGIGVSAKF